MHKKTINYEEIMQVLNFFTIYIHAQIHNKNISNDHLTQTLFE